MMSYLIYMAIRVMEMRRLLKPTGSIYLHSNQDRESLLEAVVGLAISTEELHRNEIVWNATAPRPAVAGRKEAPVQGACTDLLVYC